MIFHRGVVRRRNGGRRSVNFVYGGIHFQVLGFGAFSVSDLVRISESVQ